MKQNHCCNYKQPFNSLVFPQKVFTMSCLYPQSPVLTQFPFLLLIPVITAGPSYHSHIITQSPGHPQEMGHKSLKQSLVCSLPLQTGTLPLLPYMNHYCYQPSFFPSNELGLSVSCWLLDREPSSSIFQILSLSCNLNLRGYSLL